MIAVSQTAMAKTRELGGTARRNIGCVIRGILALRVTGLARAPRGEVVMN